MRASGHSSQPVKRIRGRPLQRTRARLLRREPLCRLCARRGRFAAATQVDHIIPLCDGGADDDSNRQPICDDCHARKTAAEGGSVKAIGCDVAGLPLDPNHPWNAKP